MSEGASGVRRAAAPWLRRSPPRPPLGDGERPRAAALRVGRTSLLALGLCAVLVPAVHALTPVQRLEASDLVSRCVPAVEEGRMADTRGLRRAEGAGADAIRAARGGEVWTSLFGGVLMQQASPQGCAVIVPGADPKLFAYWVERWSNGPDGRPWTGKWFGRLDSTAWRRFRRRGGGPVRLHAITGAGREASEMRVMRGMGGR